MSNVKCYRCGKSFALDMDAVAAWMEEHKEERPKHYSAHCHFCRRVIKVPIKQLRRQMPTEQEQEQEQESE